MAELFMYGQQMFHRKFDSANGESFVPHRPNIVTRDVTLSAYKKFATRSPTSRLFNVMTNYSGIALISTAMRKV
jgi:hypothetical protein